MKCFVLIIFSIVTSYFAYTQEKSKKIKWPGFIQLNDSVLISQTEVSIRDYGHFFLFLKKFFGNELYFKDLLPSPYNIDWVAYDPFRKVTFPIGEIYNVIDSSSENKFGHDLKGADTIIDHLYFITERPIVNVTKKQALLYCEFLTRNFDASKTNVKKEKKSRLPDKVYFRLPTRKELEEASQNDDGLISKKLKVYKEKGVIISRNYFDSLNTGDLLPYSVNSGYINKRGFVNLRGNVAEMVMDSQFSFGGSFLDPLSECLPMSTTQLIPPQQNIGFRVAVVIIK